LAARNRRSHDYADKLLYVTEDERASTGYANAQVVAARQGIRQMLNRPVRRLNHWLVAGIVVRRIARLRGPPNI
jgi:hypothetical protein